MSMADRDGEIWMDGQFVDWREANIHVLTHTLHYGMGIFEGVRCYETGSGSAIFRLKDHTQRLLNSAKIFQMNIGYSKEELMQAQLETVRRNKLKSCYIRPIVWIGSERLGIATNDNKIHMAIAAWPWGAYLGEEGLAKGIRVKTSSFARHHVNVSMVRAKASGYYINSILAHQEVCGMGYDEALLLDTEGYVSEGAGENLFIVKSGRLFTPDLASCLDGITRDSVMTIAKDFGIEIVEKRITRDEIYCADEAFFTGTAAEVTPIRELDDRSIGEGQRGPITEKIQACFFEAVSGRAPKYQSWLSPI
ncbi:MAG: branched-chain amino acid transaminase [Proteobacteria bacterium]|jgi:branched-chain amino acid aminotransferase|nr:branched-chain amino acid transaminase [Pseudomonadota bacterium]MDP4678393.1 branched-chain amino acid transaminase [Burkholderiaceae bacterium]HCO56851.1 branched chain amino acid aminotransferase [Burkholderiales bacterium]MDA1187549.1 branched-chain amino acid transaminase [Pseudomonadota bacterium]MDP4829550.1 branched-chain amino acid transaminase [Burkholderiaceae bacterium]